METEANIKKTTMETNSKDNLKNDLLEECYAMTKFLSANGKEIPIKAIPILSFEKKNGNGVEMDNLDLLKLHKELSKKIAPARPKTLWLLYKESQTKSVFNFLGPVLLVKRLMFVALLSLIMFIMISLSSQINDENIGDTIFEKSGFVLFIVLSFYLTSATLGAAFSNLFQANKFITNNTFDPKYETSYWIRLVLGIIAGFLLAVIIPMPEGLIDKEHTTNIEVFSRPLLAMLGGFSASLVYRILFRLVYAVESIFIGKQSDYADQQMANMQETNEIDKENDRQQLVSQLLTLQGEITQDKSPEEVKKEIEKTISLVTG